MRPSAWKRELEPGRTAEPVSGDPRWAGEPGAPRPIRARVPGEGRTGSGVSARRRPVAHSGPPAPALGFSKGEPSETPPRLLRLCLSVCLSVRPSVTLLPP